MSRGHSENFRAPDCRLGFDLFLLQPQKKTNDAGQPITDKNGKQVEEWGATFIYPNSTSKAPFEKAIIEACINAKWGDEAKIKEMIGAGLIKSPFLKGDGKEARFKKGEKAGELQPGYGPDVWFIRTNTRIAPPVRYKDPNIQATREEVYSGCYGFPVLNAYTWEGQTGKGVTFGLQYFQKLRDGEKLFTGGAASVDPGEYFEKIEDAGDAPAETKSGAGAGGLFG